MNCFDESEDANMLMSKGVSTVLMRLIESNQARLLQWQYQNSFVKGGQLNGNGPIGTGKTTRFDSAYVPEISIEDYVERVQMYSKCSASVYVIAMVYIDRLIEGEGLVVSHLNVHRLFITAILVAAKFYDDLSFKNAFYATLGGIEKTEMNLLEVDFLNYIKFSLVVSEDCFNSYKQHLLENPVAAHPVPPYSPTSITQNNSFSTVSSGEDWEKIAHHEYTQHTNSVFVTHG